MRWYERILYFFHGRNVEYFGYSKKKFVCHTDRIDVVFNSKEAAQLYDLYGIKGFEIAKNRGFKL